MNETNSTNNDDRWRGKRYICLVRQSDDSAGPTSTEAQLQWLKAEGERLRMIHVGDVVLTGVTGSLPGKREDLEQLLERKRTRNDFEVLLIQRMDRLTRGGSNHGFWFEHECDKVGISIRYPGDDLPEDDRYAPLIKVAKFEAAKDQARSIGQRSVQGWVYALEQGRNAVVSHAPFGCDRLYLSSDGQPLFVIRNLEDGRQQKLDPNTHAVIDTYGTVGGGSKGHYRKQRDEKVLIVPGAKEKADVVREVFDLHYRQRWGGTRIAGKLNERGILSPKGKGWSQRQVESIYDNPVYCGLALGQRMSQAIYYSRGDGRPQPVQHDAQVVATSRWAPRRWRPPEQWMWQEQPLMSDFLSADLREQALKAIEKRWMDRWHRSQDPTQPRQSTSKHKTSEYVLTGVLVAKQDGQPLTGLLCGRADKRTRYYRHRRAKLGYRKGSIYNKLIPAKPLERAVFELIQQVLQDMPNVRQRVLNVARSHRPSVDPEAELISLRQQREAVAKRLQRVLRLLTDEDYADAEPELQRLRAQRRELEEQITAKEQTLQHAAEDPEQLADRVVARLKSLADELEDISITNRRAMIEAFVERVEVDLETKDAVVSLRLPPWAMRKDGEAMRLAHSSPSPTSYETHHPLILLAHAHCRYHHDRSAKAACYYCRRRAA